MTIHGQCVAACLNEGGKVVMESVIETKASCIPQFLHGLRGELHVTWEEGTWAACSKICCNPGVASAGPRSSSSRWSEPIAETACDRSGTTGIGRGGPPRVRQSATPTGYRSGRIGDFSTVGLCHHVVSLVSRSVDRGFSTVRQLDHVDGAFLS